MSGWGSFQETESEREERQRRNGVGFGNHTPAETRKPQIVFITNDGESRAFCHKLCEHESLRFVDVRITHEAGIDAIASLVASTRLVVIATCRASLDKGSDAQEREKLAISIAQKHDIPVAILAGENHEAVQDYLAGVRGKMPLVIVPVNNGYFGEGFMECFPLRTQFVERGDTPTHIEQIARELLNRLR